MSDIYSLISEIQNIFRIAIYLTYTSYLFAPNVPTYNIVVLWQYTLNIDVVFLKTFHYVQLNDSTKYMETKIDKFETQ